MSAAFSVAILPRRRGRRVISGARTPVQARANAAVGSRSALPEHVLEQVRAIYDEKVATYVEDRS